MTEKQQLAKVRNWLKFQLLGKQIHTDSKYLTKLEKARIDKINYLIQTTVNNFDRNSSKLGLNVPEHRCYFSPCRNKTKYIGELYGKDVYFCKKHFNEYLEVYDK